jgi:hypothetical protein
MPPAFLSWVDRAEVDGLSPNAKVSRRDPDYCYDPINARLTVGMLVAPYEYRIAVRTIF